MVGSSLCFYNPSCVSLRGGMTQRLCDQGQDKLC